MKRTKKNPFFFLSAAVHMGIPCRIPQTARLAGHFKICLNLFFFLARDQRVKEKCRVCVCIYVGGFIFPIRLENPSQRRDEDSWAIIIINILVSFLLLWLLYCTYISVAVVLLATSGRWWNSLLNLLYIRYTGLLIHSFLLHRDFIGMLNRCLDRFKSPLKRNYPF